MIKKFKLFESKYFLERINSIMNKINSCQIGDILSEEIIYQYIEILHYNHDDFLDGDLASRIERYNNYKLALIDIEDLNIDEYYLDDGLIDEYIDKYNETKRYPPVVITHNNKLIDGNHRANALNDLGFSKIKAFKGIK